MQRIHLHVSDCKRGIALVVVRPLSFGTTSVIFYTLLLHVCLWPLPGRLKPLAQCAPLSRRRSRFSGDLTWKECCWSSTCPQKKTECWTPKPVKHRDRAGVGVGGFCQVSINCTAAMVTRIHLFSIFMESRSHCIFIIYQDVMLLLYPSITNVYKWCPSLRSKYPAVAFQVLSASCFHEWSLLTCYGSTVFTGCEASCHSTSLISSARSLSHDHCSTERVNIKIHTYAFISIITFSREVIFITTYVGLFVSGISDKWQYWTDF